MDRMPLRTASCALTVLLFLAGGSVASAKDAACWNLVYRVIEHNASSPHYRFITYAENERIQQDGQRYEYADAHITYRDDGLAYIDDDRWQHPFMSTWVEPGPPVLGPYGPARRSSWLAFAAPVRGLDIIADASTDERTRCIDVGTDDFGGTKYVHLVFPDSPPNHPALKAVWIDPHTLAVARVITSAWITFATEDRRVIHDLTDYTVNLEDRGGIEVVHDISWSYSYKVYDQRSTLDAHYSFAGYRFGEQPPVGTLFAVQSH